MTEHNQAKQWRERLGLTRKQLADMTGYSYESVLLFEKGKAPSRTWSTKPTRMKERPIDAYVWKRFKRCCQAVDAEMKTGEKFGW
jgi:hypothetical protein